MSSWMIDRVLALKPEAVEAMSNAEIERTVALLRWEDGEPRCPKCGTGDPYVISGRPGWRCRGCRGGFTRTTGTPLASIKMPLRDALYVIAVSVNDSMSMLKVSKRLKHRHKAVWLLYRKIRSLISGDDQSIWVGYFQTKAATAPEKPNPPRGGFALRREGGAMASSMPLPSDVSTSFRRTTSREAADGK